MTRQEYKDIYDVVGVAMEVYNVLGRGLAEPIYQEAFAVEMTKREMAFEREKELRLRYKDVWLEKKYFADFYYQGIVIELKAVDEICSDHRAQLFNYMRISQQYRGLLINFGERILHTERYLFLPEEDDFVLLTHENHQYFVTDSITKSAYFNHKSKTNKTLKQMRTNYHKLDPQINTNHVY